MPNYKTFQEPPWARESLASILEPGERIDALADFVDPATQRVSRTIVLTNRNVRFIGFNAGLLRSAAAGTLRGKKLRPVAFKFTIPLHGITGIGVKRAMGGVIQQARVVVEIHWGGAPELWQSRFAEAAELVAKLETVFGEPDLSAKTTEFAEELSKLSALTTAGLLTSGEFDRAKQAFIGRPPDEAAEAVALLRQLHDLYRTNVLSESEFNVKKWDLLGSRSLR